MSEWLAAEVFHRASATLDVGPAPVEEVVAAARTARRRRRRRTTAAVLAGVVAVAGLGWATSQAQDGDGLGDGDVRRERNPVDLPWYADGRLHLAAVSVATPQLNDLVEVAESVVYGDLAGEVVRVRPDGGRERIGLKDPRQRLVASTPEGWVAWIDPAGAGIVLYDVRTGETVGTRQIDPGEGEEQGGADGEAVRLIAIDQERVYYADAEGTHAWTPGGPESGDDATQALPVTGLLDVKSATRLRQQGRRIVMTQSLFNVEFARPGLGGALSAGGSYVLSRRASPGDPPEVGAAYRPVLYDARSGEELGSGVRSSERVLDASLGDGQVTYVVVQVADLVDAADLDGPTAPLLVLRSCTIGETVCRDLVPLRDSGGRPLLAH